MGRSGRHRHTVTTKTFRSIVLTAAAISAVAVTLITIAVTGPSSSSATSGAEAAYPPRTTHRTTGRVSRDSPRTPLPEPTDAPSAEPSDSPQAQPALKKKAPPHRAKILSRGACDASYYGSGGHTASGEAFDPDALTAAHRTLPLGSKVRIINRNNDRSVIVRINDRGPFVTGRCLDLSSAAMQAVGGLGSGVIPVRYEVLAKI